MIVCLLEDVLRKKNMSRRELARRMGCSKDTVCHYCNNSLDAVSLALLEAFCDELHCSLSDVLTEMTDAEYAAWQASRRQHV